MVEVDENYMRPSSGRNDDDSGGDDFYGSTTSSPRRRRGGGGGGAGAEEKAEKRRMAQEKRDADRLRRQEEAAHKKAERTKSQVRAQAIKLGRKYRDAGGGQLMLQSPFSELSLADYGADELALGPIVRQANGALAVGGGTEEDEELLSTKFGDSINTLQQLAMAKQDVVARSPKRRNSSSLAVVDATNNAPVTHRNPTVLVPPGPPQQQTNGGGKTGLPGTSLHSAPVPPPPPPLPSPLPGIAIGPSAPAPAPKYGALRGGTLPTYREYQQSTGASSGGILRRDNGLGDQMSEEQRQEQARLEKELQDLAIARQYENLTRLYNTLPELRRAPPPGSSSSGAGARRQSTTQRAAMHTRYVPQQRRTVRRVYHVGRTERELSMLTHSTTTRASVDDFRLHMQNVSTDKMRRALLAAKLMRAGSEAPEHLVRRIFHQRQLLVGDLVVS